MSITKTNNVWQVTQNATLSTAGKYLDSNIKINVSSITVANLLSYIYPVGSIYMSVNSTSPASFLGGTWVQITDAFLLSAGNNYSAGSTGGEATHKLTIDEMPEHTHYIAYYKSGSNDTYAYMNTTDSDWNNKYGEFEDGNDQLKPERSGVQMAGGDAAHNNMPPYLAVYTWKRTA